MTIASEPGGTKILNHCEPCKYHHIEVREGGGLLEICEVTGGRTIWGDEVLNKSDNCPFIEVEDEDKYRQID